MCSQSKHEIRRSRKRRHSKRRHLWGIIFLLSSCLASAQAQQPTPTPRPGRSYSSDNLPKTPPPPGPKAQSPVTFTDITSQAKIDFKHQGSPTSLKYLLE